MSDPWINQLKGMINSLKDEYENRIQILEQRIAQLEDTLLNQTAYVHGVVSPRSATHRAPFTLRLSPSGRGYGYEITDTGPSMPSTTQLCEWDMQRLNLGVTTGTRDNAAFVPYAIEKIVELAANMNLANTRNW